jgi:catechol 2,3-dioxygenase-like lactoylglutathione lyase family enzyme
MTTGIKHIEIAVSDLKKSLEFYGTLFAILGWKQVPEEWICYSEHKGISQAVGVP